MEHYGAKFLEETYELVYTKDKKEIESIVTSILDTYPEATDDLEEILGFDIETTGLSPHTSEVCTIQIYCPKEKQSFCFHVGDDIPECLAELIATRKLVAHNASFEAQFMTSRGIFPKDLHCSMILYKLFVNATQVVKGRVDGKLSTLMEVIFGFAANKEQQMSDWGAEELTREQKYYAAIDSIFCYRAFIELIGKIGSPTLRPLLEFYSINKRAIVPLAYMSTVGIKVDVPAHVATVAEWEEMDALALDKVRSFIPATVNLNSGKQFHAWLMEEFTQKELEDWPTSERTGHYRKDKQTIQEFSHYEQIAPLAEYYRLRKLVNTYGNSFRNLILPETMRVHCSFWQASTVTGRLSSSKPNLQQQPRGDFRKIFIPGEGMKLVCADYSQMEVRAMAHISNEKEMLKEYKKGSQADFYKLVASKLLGKAIGEVTKDERQMAKAVVLGKLYGMGAEKLRTQATFQFGVPMELEEAKEFLWVFEEGFEGYRKWKDGTVKTGEKKARNQEAVSPIGGCMRMVDPDRTYNISLNHPVQSASAAVNLQAISNVWEGLWELGPDNARMVLTVHDELVVECVDNLVDKCCVILKKGMEDAFIQFFPTATVEGLIDVNVADNWYDAKD